MLNFKTFLKFFQAKQQQRNSLVRPLPKTWSPKHIPVYQPNAQELNEVSSSDSDSEDSCWTLKLCPPLTREGLAQMWYFNDKKKKIYFTLPIPAYHFLIQALVSGQIVLCWEHSSCINCNLLIILDLVDCIVQKIILSLTVLSSKCKIYDKVSISKSLLYFIKMIYHKCAHKDQRFPTKNLS